MFLEAERVQGGKISDINRSEDETLTTCFEDAIVQITIPTLIINTAKYLLILYLK